MRELADVVQEPADREVAQSFGREPELVADLYRAESDAARVLLRVLVLLREFDEERAHVRPEERFLLGDEVGAPQVAEQRARARDSATEVEGDGNPDGRDPDDLESVPEPPAEVLKVEEKRRRQRAREPDDADGDDEVAGRLVRRNVRSARQKSSAKNVSPAQRTIKASGLRGSGTGGTRPGSSRAREAEAEDEDDPAARSASSGRTAAGRRAPRARRAREWHRRPGGWRHR